MSQPKQNNKDEEKGKQKLISTESPAEKTKEYGGRKDGLDPTRYGDWEKNGRCIDF